MSEVKYFWITRNRNEEGYFVWSEQPTWDVDQGMWRGKNDCAANDWLYASIFTKVTGLKMKGGPRSITKRRLAK